MITAQDINKLRKQTGADMLDYKKSLTEEKRVNNYLLPRLTELPLKGLYLLRPMAKPITG